MNTQNQYASNPLQGCAVLNNTANRICSDLDQINAKSVGPHAGFAAITMANSEIRSEIRSAVGVSLTEVLLGASFSARNVRFLSFTGVVKAESIIAEMSLVGREATIAVQH